MAPRRFRAELETGEATLPWTSCAHRDVGSRLDVAIAAHERLHAISSTSARSPAWNEPHDARSISRRLAPIAKRRSAPRTSRRFAAGANRCFALGTNPHVAPVTKPSPCADDDSVALHGVRIRETRRNARQ